MIKTCDNPNCKKNFITESEDQRFCSVKCAKETIKPRKWKTASIDEEVKRELGLIKYDIIQKIGKELSENSIIKYLIKLANIKTNNNLSEGILKLMLKE